MTSKILGLWNTCPINPLPLSVVETCAYAEVTLMVRLHYMTKEKRVWRYNSSPFWRCEFTCWPDKATSHVINSLRRGTVSRACGCWESQSDKYEALISDNDVNELGRGLWAPCVNAAQLTSCFQPCKTLTHAPSSAMPGLGPMQTEICVVLGWPPGLWWAIMQQLTIRTIEDPLAGILNVCHYISSLHWMASTKQTRETHFLIVLIEATCRRSKSQSASLVSSEASFLGLPTPPWILMWCFLCVTRRYVSWSPLLRRQQSWWIETHPKDLISF